MKRIASFVVLILAALVWAPARTAAQETETAKPAFAPEVPPPITRKKPAVVKVELKAKVGENVRIYFGNGGPNKISSFHVIGEIFDRVYREGGMSAEGDKNIQITLVPAGGGAIVEFKLDVPGAYTLVDHAIFRIEKGAIGQIQVSGAAAPDIYKAIK